MKRILYLANLNPNKFGSMEEHALFLSRELKRRGDCCYLAFIAEPSPEIKELLETAGARIMVVAHDERALFSDLTGTLQQALNLRRIVQKERIDLVHVNFVRLTNPLLWGLYLSRAVLVFTDHASGLDLRRSFLKTALSKMLHWVLSRRVARYIGVSDYVRQRMKDTHHVSGDKTVTLYNGVNVERFAPGDKAAARHALGIPADVKLVCTVAMIIPEKGVQFLIEAAAILAHEHARKDLLVVVVGEGDYREELERLAHERNVADLVKFWGRRSDVHAIVTAADVVAVPSVWGESFGLIIAEAMASARPVVASRTGGIPELIENGTTGLLVAPGNAAELADSLDTFLQEPELRQRVADAALMKVRQEFNLSVQVSKQVDLYERVLVDGSFTCRG